VYLLSGTRGGCPQDTAIGCAGKVFQCVKLKYITSIIVKRQWEMCRQRGIFACGKNEYFIIVNISKPNIEPKLN